MASKKKTAKSGKAKPAAKAAPRKSVQRPKSAPRKAVQRAKPSPRKAVQRPKPAPRKASRPAVAKKKAVPRPAPRSAKPAKVKAPRPAAPARPSAAPAPKAVEIKIKPMGKKDLEFFRKLLLNLRDRIVDEISFLAGENLNHSQREASGDLSNYGMHMADQGTDNFDREFALSLVSNEQEVLYEIDDALHRVDNGTYGVCELTGQPIEVERLKVLPYARYSREAQEQMEKNRKRFRPFVSSPSQGQSSSSQEF